MSMILFSMMMGAIITIFSSILELFFPIAIGNNAIILFVFGMVIPVIIVTRDKFLDFMDNKFGIFKNEL